MVEKEDGEEPHLESSGDDATASTTNAPTGPERPPALEIPPNERWWEKKRERNASHSRSRRSNKGLQDDSGGYPYSPSSPNAQVLYSYPASFRAPVRENTGNGVGVELKETVRGG